MASYLWDAEASRWAPRHEVLAARAAKTVNRRSFLPTPAVVGIMGEIKSMADGQIYSDRRTYERSLARHGCEVVGFDKNWTDYVKPAHDEKAHEAEIVSDVKRAIEEVSSTS